MNAITTVCIEATMTTELSAAEFEEKKALLKKTIEERIEALLPQIYAEVGAIALDVNFGVDVMYFEHDDHAKRIPITEPEALTNTPGMRLKASMLSTARRWPVKRKWSKELIIQKLRVKAGELGQSPIPADLNTDRNMPRYCVIQSYFGSLPDALAAAGLHPRGRKKMRWYSDEELLKMLRALADILGHPPSATDHRRNRDKVPHIDTYIARFGSWNAAVEKAGLLSTAVGSALYKRELNDIYAASEKAWSQDAL